MDEFWLDCMEKVNSRLKADWDNENACGPIKYAPSRVHDQDTAGLVIMDDIGTYIHLKYPVPSEEYINTINYFMEKIKKDIESVCFYGDRPDMIIVDDPHYNEGLFKAVAETSERLAVVAMGGGTGGWPKSPNDWSKVYQKAFPEAPEGQQTPTQIDPKDMSVKAETEEDRERLWQSIMDVARGG